MGEILSRRRLDPTATMEFIAQGDGLLCGVQEAVVMLRGLPTRRLQVWALEEGASLKRGDVALRVRGPFREYERCESELTGTLAASSGWATAARQLVKTVEPLPVIFNSPRTLHPQLMTQCEHAARIAGCLDNDSKWGAGVLTRALVMVFGDTVRAAQAFDQEAPPGIPRLAPVDSFFNAPDEAVRVALAMGDKLAGVIVECAQEHPLTPALFQMMRDQLDLAGFPRVKIFVSGDITPERAREWHDSDASLDGYFAGDAIGGAPPLPFAAELKECDNKPIGRRGQSPGTTVSPRLIKVEM